jgi:hypothetical protein
MEPYLLTEEDIKKLGINNAMAGEPATEQEIAELNKIDPSSVLPVLPTKK